VDYFTVLSRNLHTVLSKIPTVSKNVSLIQHTNTGRITLRTNCVYCYVCGAIQTKLGLKYQIPVIFPTTLMYLQLRHDTLSYTVVTYVGPNSILYYTVNIRYPSLIRSCNKVVREKNRIARTYFPIC